MKKANGQRSKAQSPNLGCTDMGMESWKDRQYHENTEQGPHIFLSLTI